ncbi:hypothetical protein EV191_1176 [Tamaricihabitans halophyticus]|uniref:FAR-17a/AIG1-like protein n=1 Tax=Tamaricihabitans halophyticus TaxID=1262583 RepID=A0A4R2Q8A8_9PSEU|nr:hypothetical protein EV191_1176 [Tamaricihabitans halophyticus]
MVALVIQLALVFMGGGGAGAPLTDGSTSVAVRLWRMFSFFTIQSNLLVLATAVILMWRPAHDGRFWRVLRLDAMLGILITGLVFAIVLAPQIHLTGWDLVASTGFHYIVPWGALAAWLFFGPRPRISWGTVAAAFLWPVLWLSYIFIQGVFTRWYPYPFLDVTTIGFGTALRNVTLVLILAAALAGILKFLDYRLPALPRAANVNRAGRH